MPKVPTIQDLAKLSLLNPSQREKLETEIESLERGLKGFSMDGDGDQMPMFPDPRFPFPDRAVLQESLRRNQQTLAKGTPPDYTTSQKNGLFVDYKRWVEEYREGMPSSDQMERPTWENVQLHMRHEQRNVERGPAIKAATKVLDTDLEDFSLEALRPSQPSSINYRALMDGMDHQVWTEGQELERALEDLDESQYAEFLKLRAYGIETPKLIQRTAHLSQAQYDACMHRFQAEAPVGMGQENGQSASLLTSPARMPKKVKQPVQRPGKRHEKSPQPPPFTSDEVSRVCTYLDALTEPPDLAQAAASLHLSQERIALIVQARGLEPAAAAV